MPVVARPLAAFERPLVAHLLTQAGLPAGMSTLRGRPMDDGGMGSFAFAPCADIPYAEGSRRLGRVASEVWFDDADGVPVLASLFLDEEGAPFELDVWKVDFSPLQRWPGSDDLTLD